MKPWIFWLCLFLSGCTTWAGVTEDREVYAKDAPQPETPVRQVSRDRTFHNLESLVTFRHEGCQLPVEERNQLLEAYREMSSDEAVLGALMLATCEPDRTPGLLANSLVEARSLQDPPPGFPAFLELLEAEAKSYSLLERRLRQTQQKLDDMIQGIRAIEAEMGQPTEGDSVR